jgi:hypothetical protein
VSAGIKAGFAGHGSHRPGSVCFECERENAMTPDSEAGPVKDWYDRDAEAFGRAHRQSQAQPVPSGLDEVRDRMTDLLEYKRAHPVSGGIGTRILALAEAIARLAGTTAPAAKEKG